MLGAARIFEAGQPTQALVEMERGLMFVMAISDGSSLAVLASPDCDTDLVAYEMSLLVEAVDDVLTPAARARGLRRAQAEEEAVGGDGGGTGDEQGDAGRGSGDRLEQPGAVQGADGAEQPALGHGLARGHGRLPPALVLAAQPQEAAQVGGLVPEAGRRGAGHAERREDPVEAAHVRVDGRPLDQAASAGLGDDRGNPG